MVSGKLNSLACEKAAAKEKRYFLQDGDGLALQVEPSGRKIWKLRYYFEGRQSMITVGPYPEISLKDARVSASQLRLMIARGENPVAGKKARKEGGDTASMFQTLAMDWYNSVHATQVVEAHAVRNLSRLKKMVFPYIGTKRPDEITPPMVLELLKRICDTGYVETAHRVKSVISLIFRYGISLGRAERDPTRDLAGMLPSYRTEHFPAILDTRDLGGLLRSLDGYNGSIVVRSAARLLPLVFSRPGELLGMKWADIDPAAALWTWKTSKTQTQMMTPLSRQAMQILAEVHPLTSDGENVFPALRGKGRTLSNTSIKAALDSMGYGGRMTAHGWRAVARTHLVETLGYPESVVEMQLGHNVRDALGRAYNRTTFLDQRKEMMQRWADWLDELRKLPAAVGPEVAAAGKDAWSQWRG
ncbi:tyrosine-type recombinase/integrase [Desulfobotulus sp.]|jgi:integrase|uniref:tyrosine-type recombinase/integrase n=1 Tax=Desulfobotulus sp. TaxID=1940337 RepID=UPI002A35E700|nr:integrase arm-type DNA-binding domain-containing protein [Desulfobotulus sp.]MDY0162381.1 integrase arm-type DNA-binding domain-containing protein [Desulfobotulus sp.]